MTIPGYWMNETTGVLKPAIMAYLYGHELSEHQVAAIRAYIRQWIMSEAWERNPHADPSARWLSRMRARVDDLVDRESISQWMRDALEGGIDPL